MTEQGDPLAKQFAGRLDTLYRLEPGASLRFKFKGTKVSIYDLLGPDGCLVEITVDGKSRESRRMDGYCTYTRIGTLGVGDNMPDTIHEVSIRVLDKQFDKSQVLFERNRHKMAENPEAYESYLWHPSSIFLVGELVE